MTKDELRRRINHLGLSPREAAKQLGLSVPGLHHQVNGVRRVTRQTEIILERLEDDQRRAREDRRVSRDQP
jgi:hypothetical protein